MKQTAVQWLVENYLPLKRGIEVDHQHTIKVVSQAKEMEKEQRGYSEEDMQESYKKGYANGQMDAFIN
jgi:hypothetical protein